MWTSPLTQGRAKAIALAVGALLLAACNLPSAPPQPPTPTRAPAPTPTLGPAPCGDDVDCLAQAARACTPSQGDLITTAEMMGVRSSQTLHFVIQGPDAQGACAFEVQTTATQLVFTDEAREQMKAAGLSDAEIEAQIQQMEEALRANSPSGHCTGQGEALADLIAAWQQGNFSLDDWAPFVCTDGTLAAMAGQSEIVVTAEVEAEVTVENPPDRTPTPALQGTPTLTPIPASNPILVYTGEGTYQGVHYFYLKVANWRVYPREMFTRSDRYPRCANYGSPSRTWVRVIDADTAEVIFQLCSYQVPGNLEELYFPWTQPGRPRHVQVDLWDRATDTHYLSNVLNIPAP